MRPYRRRDGASYYVDVRWKGLPRIRLSTDTNVKARANAMATTLEALRAAGRRDTLELLAAKRLRLADVHDAYVLSPEALEHRVARARSPALGALVAEWLVWLRSPAGISPLTRRRITPRTAQRYEVSWSGFFAVLPKGRDASLADITRGFVADYRVSRTRATGGLARKTHPGRPLSPATLNRDVAALGAFLRWVREVKGLAVAPLKLARERESRGRIRWLSSDELASFERACPGEWWPLFATLFHTGMRVGEAMGLRGGDVLLSARRIQIHEGERRVKTQEAVRDLPIPDILETALAQHLARVAPSPADLLFPGHMQRYAAVRRTWKVVCSAAGIHGATIHDARHTFAVHAIQAGVPIVRLQKLLGHATALMTLRYAQHAPQAYLDEDAALIARHMTGAADPERDARVAAARRGMRTA
jgi:integrase